jgi:hypothetical protein
MKLPIGVPELKDSTKKTLKKGKLEKPFFYSFRERELGILNKLQDHLEEKFGAVSDFIQIRKY